MMYSIAILLIIGIAIYLIRIRYNNFIKRRKLPDNLNNNVDGMLVELVDKGLDVSITDDSVEGKFSLVISSKSKFEYSDVSDYILQVRDYLSIFNYNNLNIFYRLSNINEVRYDSKVENIPNYKINHIYIAFEIDKNFIDRALFGRTEDTGPR